MPSNVTVQALPLQIAATGQRTSSLNTVGVKTASTLYSANPTRQNQIHVDGSRYVGVDNFTSHRTVQLDSNTADVIIKTPSGQINLSDIAARLEALSQAIDAFTTACGSHIPGSNEGFSIDQPPSDAK